MKKMILLFVITAIEILGVEYKDYKKSFTVDPGKNIELNCVSGMDVKLRSWDKNEVSFNLRIKIKSSDEDYEKSYVRDFDIKQWQSSDEIIIDIVENDENGSWSFWDIFRFKFQFSVEKEIKGEIYIPVNNPLETNIKYSEINLRDMTGEINIIGRANEIKLENCSDIRRISNNYGNTAIYNCGGKLDLESRSNKVKIESFNGEAFIDAQYSEIKIKNITSHLKLNTRSANVLIEKVNGNCKVSGDYSTITISDVKGMVDVEDRSGNVEIVNSGGVNFNGPYSRLGIETVSGSAANDLKITNRSGSIKLKNVIGNIFIDDSYSNMEFINITGDVDLTSRSGKIIGKNIEGSWSSKTQYSRITIDGLRADFINIVNRSEPIVLQLKSIPNQIEIKNDYGNVDLSMPQDFSGDVSLSATHGDINTSFPLSYKNKGSVTTAKGKVGTGSNKLKIETRSGNITIKDLL